MTVFEEDLSQQRMARLSDEMVRLYKEQFGRGPTRVRSHFAGRTPSSWCSRRRSSAEVFALEPLEA
jgi:uncharacterized protein YbcI